MFHNPCNKISIYKSLINLLKTIDKINQLINTERNYKLRKRNQMLLESSKMELISRLIH